MSIRSALCFTLCVVPLWGGCSISWGGDNSENKTPPKKDALGIVLANVTEAALSEDCASGGVDIETGVDKNADGELSADEVSRILTVCHGASGKNALVETEVLAAGDECPAGGLRVRSGLDDDRDGALSAAEIVRNDVICNGAAGADGLTSLVVIVDVEAGEVCTSGGVRISAGVDANGDGSLAPEETSETAVVCHGKDGLSALVRTSSVDESDAVCLYGGTRIEVGVDDNGDGVLQDDEVTAESTQYICNGAPGPRGDAGPAGGDGSDGAPNLVRTTGLEVGDANCPYGGARVEVGVDVDGDGTLQDTEVNATLTRYICNGAPGPRGDAGPAGGDGNDGDSAYVRTTPLSDDDGNCPAGGARVEAWVDKDEDGEVDVDEQASLSTVYICNGDNGDNTTCETFYGSIQVNNSFQLSALAGCTEVVGEVFLEGDFLPPTFAELDALKRIQGNLTLNGSFASTQVLPGLEEVTGTITFQLDQPSIELPSLRSTAQLEFGKEFFVSPLESVSFPALENLAIIQVYGLSLLQRCSLEVLAGRLDADLSITCDDYNYDCVQGQGDHDLDGLCAPDDLCPYDASSNVLDTNGDCPCSAGFHNGGTTQCLPDGKCARGYLLNEDGRCRVECLSVDNHDGGNGVCVPAGTCASGYHDGGDGTCLGMPQVSVGLYHACGVRVDGSITCWGLGSHGAPAGRFDSVSMGSGTTCGVRSDGRILCWDSEMGNQTYAPAGSFQSVSVGYGHTCAVRSDSSISCWGSNDYGQTEAPAGNFQSVSAGGAHTCAVRSDSSISCWGRDDYGQTTAPARSFQSVSAGGAHTCAVASDGGIICWGGNYSGQTDAPAGSFRSVSAGPSYTCGVRSDASIVCWGAEGPSGRFHSVSAGSDVACGVRSEGSIACWVVESNPDNGWAYYAVPEFSYCSTGYNDDGTGTGVCVAIGSCATGYHNGGDGRCVPEEKCSQGYQLNSSGECAVATNPDAGYALDAGEADSDADTDAGELGSEDGLVVDQCASFNETQCVAPCYWVGGGSGGGSSGCVLGAASDADTDAGELGSEDGLVVDQCASFNETQCVAPCYWVGGGSGIGCVLP